MGEIIILKKSQADLLSSLGFKYTEKIIDGKTVYVFIQTDELMAVVSSKFDRGSFAVSKTVNF